MQNIKRIHVHVGKKATTISMDSSLHLYLDRCLVDKRLSVRQWVQLKIDKMLSDNTLSETTKTSSVSRRVQAEAIRLIASTCPDAPAPAAQQSPSALDDEV